MQYADISIHTQRTTPPPEKALIDSITCYWQCMDCSTQDQALLSSLTMLSCFVFFLS